MEYSSAIKKSEIMPFGAMRMDLESIVSEISQKEKNKLSCDITYLWKLKE